MTQQGQTAIMRRFPARPNLPGPTLARLQEKTDELQQIQDLQAKKARAREMYDASRGTAWFTPVVDALRGLCGPGELCMYCSSNEPSQVEHFRPLTTFPQSAFEYVNYLWSCDICNRTHKGERFPPHTGPGELIINPLDENVWDFFFVDDEFGRLICRVDPVSGERMARAVSTCDVVGIDRENVQIKRARRFKNLRRDAQRALEGHQAGNLTIADLNAHVEEWRTEPFQADVADYFLNGPGRDKEPFAALFAAIQA